MADFKITNRDTDSRTSRGSTSVQSYLAPTVRTVSSTPSGYTETRTQIGTITTDSTTNRGDVRETRTTTGVSKTTTQSEDKGVILKFRIPIQQKNPIQRQS
ncbi:hypothetical protein OAG69_00185 [bacterium]|nr:hypothetical protein [bacterium]